MTRPDAGPERFWEELLENIECGRVIPVVGQDLLGITIDGTSRKLYPHLADTLAEKLGVGTAPDDSLNAVVCRYKDQTQDLNLAYTQVYSLLRKAGNLPIPGALSQLASIAPFTLFVSTTFDDLLRRALDQVRFGDQPRTRTLAYAPNRPIDVTSEQLRSQVPLVYQLFGQVSPTPDYALTDQDVLEHVHALQSEDRRPQRLFDELSSRSLLLIGNNFSDWLARFFIRMAGRDSLPSRRKTDFIADLRVHEDPDLVYFLRHFSTTTRLFPQSATDFVDELHRRWTAQHPQQATPGVVAPPATPSAEDGWIFLSYAREDLGAARALRDALQQAGLPVWMDDELRCGDDWERRLATVIDASALFVAVVSSHWVTLREGYFRAECRHAYRRAVNIRNDINFVLPVVIDATREDDPNLPRDLPSSHWGRAPAGRPEARVLEDIRRSFDAYRAARGGQP